MAEQAIVAVHIAAGFAVFLFGAAAMALAKGGTAHRLCGNLFFGAMGALLVSGVTLGLLRPEVMGANTLGMLTFYLAATGWKTARTREGKPDAFEWGAIAFAVTTAVCAFIAGWTGANDPVGAKARMFAPAAYVISGLAVLFAAIDVSVVLRGGVVGAKRFARHVWRMGFAMVFGAAAGFIGQGARFPERVQPVLSGVVLLSLILTLVWLARVRFTRWRMNLPERIPST